MAMFPVEKIKTGLKISSALSRACYLGMLLIPLSPEPAVAANLVINGSFESPELPENSWSVLPSLVGWDRAQGPGIEVHHNITGAPADGSQYVELDGNPAKSNLDPSSLVNSPYQSTRLYQDLVTIPGQTYQLQFAFSPRPDTSASENVLGIWWAGSQLDILTADGSGLSDTVWTDLSYAVLATSRRTRLEFADLGPPDTFGTYLDAVSLEPSSPEPVPEANSLLGLLVLAAVGTGLRLKRVRNF